MTEETQNEIIQSIVSEVVEVLPVAWLEVILNYKVEGDHSQFVNSYLVNEASGNIEKSVPSIDNLDQTFRQLRDHISGDNREPFTKCIVHFESSGEFDVEYGYDPIDWDELPGWNFKVNG